MNIVFMRHAIAMEREDFHGASDSERPLTKPGITEFKSFLKLLGEMMPQPDLIYSSPFVRTRQTSELVCEAYGGKMEFLDSLKPGGSSKSLMKTIQECAVKTVYIVGHQPDLGMHLNYFVKDVDGDEDSFCQFKKGGFVWLKSAKKLEKGKVELVCSIHPPQLRKLNLLKS